MGRRDVFVAKNSTWSEKCILLVFCIMMAGMYAQRNKLFAEIYFNLLNLNSCKMEEKIIKIEYVGGVYSPSPPKLLSILNVSWRTQINNETCVLWTTNAHIRPIRFLIKQSENAGVWKSTCAFKCYTLNQSGTHSM